MEQQYCFYNGLIRYYEPFGFGFGYVSVNKETKGDLIENKNIPVIGTLDKVVAYNKKLINKERLNYQKTLKRHCYT